MVQKLQLGLDPGFVHSQKAFLLEVLLHNPADVWILRGDPLLHARLAERWLGSHGEGEFQTGPGARQAGFLQQVGVPVVERSEFLAVFFYFAYGCFSPPVCRIGQLYAASIIRPAAVVKRMRDLEIGVRTPDNWLKP